MPSWSPEVADAAYGALLGSAVGNAAGTMLPIYVRNSKSAVEAALRWQTRSRRAPGQISCDVEMALVMSQALAEAPAGSLPLSRLIHWYLRWTESNPSGYGGTLRSALTIYARQSSHGLDVEAILSAVANPLINSSAGSQSNGSLMRAVPLAIWGHMLPVDSLAACAREESALTHPSAPCCDAVAAYVLAVAHLIANWRDAQGALDVVMGWAQSHACKEVRGWLEEVISGNAAVGNRLKDIEWVRWPFQAAFTHLAARAGFLDGVQATLAAGGDPCTNACVVGGMLGALNGAAAVPEHLAADVLSCRIGTRGIERVGFMQSGLIPELTDRLLSRAYA